MQIISIVIHDDMTRIYKIQKDKVSDRMDMPNQQTKCVNCDETRIRGHAIARLFVRMFVFVHTTLNIAQQTANKQL